MSTGPALRLYAEDHPALARKLRAKLEQLVQEQGGHLIRGKASDFADYRNRTGFIAGLMTAIDMCEQTEKELG